MSERLSLPGRELPHYTSAFGRK